MASITVYGYSSGETTVHTLGDVWIYWKIGSEVTVLRTGADAVLKSALLTANSAEPNPNDKMPWVYTAPFDVPYGTAAKVAFTRGAKPVPASQLSNDHYTSIVVGNPWPDPFTAPANTNAEEIWITVGAPNAVGFMFNLDILIPDHKTELTTPIELDVWPLLRDHIPDDGAYYTTGLSQGRAIWTGNTNFDGENGPVAAAPEDQRPMERPLRITGFLDKRATGANLILLDGRGAAIPLKTSATANNTVPQLPVEMAPSGGSFVLDIWIGRTELALGPVQILLNSTGATPPFSDAYFLQLTGIQVGLTDDYSANPNGRVAGTPPNAADDRMIVDFAISPRLTLDSLRAQTRARRMTPYSMHLRTRQFSGTVADMVEKPEMPFWMAELQLAGFNKVGLRELLNYRNHLLDKNPTELKLEYEWSLSLGWDGPDAATGHARCYSYNNEWRENGQSVTIKLGTDREIAGVGTDNRISNAYFRAPRRVPFPVAERRLAAVWPGTQRRAWGRHAGAGTCDTLIVEWQPSIVDDGGDEAMRGGDGRLDLLNLTIAGNEVRPPAVDTSVARLPMFRMQGTNPVADLNAAIDAATAEYYNAHRGEDEVEALSLATWQQTIRDILMHEARNTQFGFLLQHYTTATDTCGVDTAYYYGLERNMPIFGFPHGYGVGQHDNPRVTDNACWSYIDNIRGSVRLLMDDKATATWNLLSQHEEDTNAWRAAFQRNVVRQYNSGRHEFTWSGGAWKISPDQNKTATNAAGAIIPNPRLTYPNDVLGTDVDYWTGNGTNEATDFPWPINFVQADWGQMP